MKYILVCLGICVFPVYAADNPGFSTQSPAGVNKMAQVLPNPGSDFQSLAPHENNKKTIVNNQSVNVTTGAPDNTTQPSSFPNRQTLDVIVEPTNVPPAQNSQLPQ